MIEDNPDQKIQSKRKTYAAVAFGSKNFSTEQLKMYIFEKIIRQFIWHFLSLHTFYGKQPSQQLSPQRTNLLHVFSKRWQFRQHCGMHVIVLQFNLKIEHLAGSVNTAADFVSRLELEVREELRLKIRENIQTTPIEVTTSSSDVADAEQAFFTLADNQDESEEQTFDWKEQYRQNAKQWVANEEPSSLKTNVREFYKNRRKHYVVFHERNQNKCTNTSRARYRFCFEDMKLKIPGQPHDQLLMTTDSR